MTGRHPFSSLSTCVQSGLDFQPTDQPRGNWIVLNPGIPVYGKLNPPLTRAFVMMVDARTSKGRPMSMSCGVANGDGGGVISGLVGGVGVTGGLCCGVALGVIVGGAVVGVSEGGTQADRRIAIKRMTRFITCPSCCLSPSGRAP